MAIIQSSSSPAGPSRQPATHRDLHKLNPDIIIIGAGIAGTALAYSLSTTQKRRVLLLERDLSEPDRIVGELLQPGGVAALTKLGLSHCLEGIDATPVEGYCVVNGGEIVGVPYPELDKMAGGSGQMSSEEQYLTGGRTEEWHVASKSGLKEGRSFHHGRLIASLRNACLTAPTDNLTVMEATVRDLIYCDHTNRVIGVTAAFKQPKAAPQDGAEDATHAEEKETVVRNVYAPITIVADGCFSKFRNTPGAKLPTPQTRSHFVGVIIKDTDLPMKYKGTVCLTPEGPVLLYQIGNKAEEIRMLVDVKGKLPNVANGSLKKHILEKYLPHLPASLHEPIRHALDTQRLRTMPNSFLPPSMQGRHHTPAGLIMVGDAWNMRHPLTGGGMTVAFNDAVLLTEYLGIDRLGEGREALEDWNKISEGLREWFWRRKNLAGVVNVLSMALYDLFGGSEEPDLEVLREGCFRYFQLGGECIAGPVGLLSAVTPKPLLLFYHFFSVAFYSIYILFTTGRPPAHGEKAVKPTLLDVPGLMLFSCKVFYTACVVLLPMIFTEFRL